MPWVMEVIATCKKCAGATTTDGTPCPECGGMGSAWYPVHGKSAPVYVYEKKEQAIRIAKICYRDAVRNWRLGGEATVRVREVTDAPAPGTPGPR